MNRYLERLAGLPVPGTIPYAVPPAVPPARRGPRSFTTIARALEAIGAELWSRDDETANAILAHAHHLHAMQSAIDAVEVHELDQLCAHCGHDRGEHRVDAPHGCEAENVRGDEVTPCRCTAYLAPGATTAAKAHETDRPPPPAPASGVR